ncbi:DUF2513 domain-containing protein [Pseudomonas promysalinigenes]|uniref:DUF2513 domain-containing protein n=1 Tax=Pseudomonas promysalinigenes TaxID=485898 RepID=UPI0037C953AB
MRRDMDLLRLLLLKLEVASEKAAPILCYRPGELSIDGYTDDHVRYHYALQKSTL